MYMGGRLPLSDSRTESFVLEIVRLVRGSYGMQLSKQSRFLALPDMSDKDKRLASMGLSTRYIARTGGVKQERPRAQDHPEI